MAAVRETPLLALEARVAQESLAHYMGAARICRVLNLGFGRGDESGSLAAIFEARIYAIDLHHPDHHSRDLSVRYTVADGRLLPFAGHSFDLVYCFHVLEHITPPEPVVVEIRRVLRQGGGLFVGTPNRSRFLGYLGSREASWRQKVLWNLKDYQMRLAGRFRNEYGAHAGFTAPELSTLLRSCFAHVVPVHRMYYAHKYPRLSRYWNPARPLGLERVLFPSVYFLCF